MIVHTHPPRTLEARLRPLIRDVDERVDCADFRVACLLHALYAVPDELGADLTAEIERCLVGFKYWIDEPGRDSMCYWSENHQVLFAVAEYLAGQRFPHAVFTNNAMTGTQHRAKARTRLERWLHHRFRFGFSEWLSNTYYEEDVAALALFIDHADDPELVTRATIVLDLLMLDLAMHRFEGSFVASMGRAYEEPKRNPATAPVSDIVHHAFESPLNADEYPLDRLSAAFVRSSYRVPAAIRAIAHDRGTHTLRASYGLDLHEVVPLFGDATDIERVGMLFWLMEAFTTPESIDVTLKTFVEYDLQHNAFLRALGPFTKLRRTRLAPTMVRALNPVTRGVALERADVQTHRAPGYLLSSAQGYRPGGFGDQHHLWHAALPGGIQVFATHPGVPMLDAQTRNQTPNYWVGNGINPHVAQDGRRLLALYDVRARRGYLERGRQQFSHLHFPFLRFDETRLGEEVLAGRAGRSLIGVRSIEPMEMTSETEVQQFGEVTAYAVVLADLDEHGSFDQFFDSLKAQPLRYDHDTLTWWTSEARYSLRHGAAFARDDRELPQRYPRFETPWVSAERDPSRMVVEADYHRLTLDFAGGVRSEE